MKETLIKLLSSRRVWIATGAVLAPLFSKWLSPEQLHTVKELAEVLIAALTLETVAEKIPMAPKGLKLVPILAPPVPPPVLEAK